MVWEKKILCRTNTNVRKKTNIIASFVKYRRRERRILIFVKVINSVTKPKREKAIQLHSSNQYMNIAVINSNTIT